MWGAGIKADYQRTPPVEQTEIRDGDDHLTHPVECLSCHWVGFTGDLIASGKKPKLYCPKCESMEIGNVKIVNT